MHEDFSRQHEVKMGSNRAFGLVVAGGFTLVTFAPWLRHREPHWWGLLVTVPLAVLALVRPGALSPLNRAWTRLGLLLNRITSPVMLGLVFYLAVAPTGLLMRAFGYDSLRRKRDLDAATYWISRGPDQSSMTQQF